MLFRFRRMRSMDPLQVAMTGVRMGERCLQIFCSDLTLTRGLATKTGLSGVAALAARDERQAARAATAAKKAGVLIDVKITPTGVLPWPDRVFDMVVVDDTDGSFARLTEADRAEWLAGTLRVLRTGGRVEIVSRIGAGFLGGSSALPDDERSGGTEGALRAAGFRPVRMLAEKDGFRFVEGLKG